MLASASLCSRTFPFTSICSQRTTFNERLFRRDAETSMRDACATRNFATLNAVARLHEYQGKRFLPLTDSKSRAAGPHRLPTKLSPLRRSGQRRLSLRFKPGLQDAQGSVESPFAKKPEDVRAHAERMLAMKVGQVPVEAVLVEEDRSIGSFSFIRDR